MAKKKKAKKVKQKAKSESKPSPKACTTCKPKSMTKWIAGVVVVVVIILLIFYGRKAPVPEAPEVEPELPVEEIQEEFDEEEGMLEPSEVEILTDQTGHQADVYSKIFWEDGSFFSGIRCMKSTGYKTDELEFKVTNKEEVPIYLGYVTPGDSSKNAVKFEINGRQLKNEEGVEKACGKEEVAPGETVTCKFVEPLRHYGPTGVQSPNKLFIRVRSTRTTSLVEFYC